MLEFSYENDRLGEMSRERFNIGPYLRIRRDVPEGRSYSRANTLNYVVIYEF